MAFPYFDNTLSVNVVTTASINSTTTPTGIDTLNAVWSPALMLRVPSGGNGTLAYQPVHSDDNSSFVNVPAAAILDSTTGLATTIANTTSAAALQTVYLARDQIKRYVSVTVTPTPSGTQTVNLFLLFPRAYTSQAV